MVSQVMTCNPASGLTCSGHIFMSLVFHFTNCIVRCGVFLLVSCFLLVVVGFLGDFCLFWCFFFFLHLRDPVRVSQ